MTTPDLEVIDRVEDTTKVQLPQLYKVVLYNDNHTTVDFVVDVLIRIFHKSFDDALTVTTNIHEQGSGVAGAPYTKEIAEQKSLETIHAARINNFPLVAAFEPL